MIVIRFIPLLIVMGIVFLMFGCSEPSLSEFACPSTAGVLVGERRVVSETRDEQGQLTAISATFYCRYVHTSGLTCKEVSGWVLSTENPENERIKSLFFVTCVYTDSDGAES